MTSILSTAHLLHQEKLLSSAASSFEILPLKKIDIRGTLDFTTEEVATLRFIIQDSPIQKDKFFLLSINPLPTIVLPLSAKTMICGDKLQVMIPIEDKMIELPFYPQKEIEYHIEAVIIQERELLNGIAQEIILYKAKDG